MASRQFQVKSGRARVREAIGAVSPFDGDDIVVVRIKPINRVVVIYDTIVTGMDPEDWNEVHVPRSYIEKMRLLVEDEQGRMAWGAAKNAFAQAEKEWFETGEGRHVTTDGRRKSYNGDTPIQRFRAIMNRDPRKFLELEVTDRVVGVVHTDEQKQAADAAAKVAQKLAPQTNGPGTTNHGLPVASTHYYDGPPAAVTNVTDPESLDGDARTAASQETQVPDITPDDGDRKDRELQANPSVQAQPAQKRGKRR